MNHGRRTSLHRSRGPSLRIGAVLGLGLLFVLLSTGVALAQSTTAATSSPDYLKWTFRILAFFTLLGGCATIVMRNPVVSVLCLVGTLFCTGGIYLVMHCTFLAAIQVLVYAGAIMVLFIFVVMSVGPIDHEEVVGQGSIASKFVGAMAVALLVFVISPLFRTIGVPRMADISNQPDFGKVEYVGRLLFGDYLFPFEALSILLLVSIVGAVLITRKRHRTAVQEPAASREG